MGSVRAGARPLPSSPSPKALHPARRQFVDWHADHHDGNQLPRREVTRRGRKVAGLLRVLHHTGVRLQPLTPDRDPPGRYCICDEREAAENMRKLSSLSRAMFAGMGEMFGYTPGSIDDLFYWPLDLDAERGEKYRPVYPQPAADRPLRIVHAP